MPGMVYIPGGSEPRREPLGPAAYAPPQNFPIDMNIAGQNVPVTPATPPRRKSRLPMIAGLVLAALILGTGSYFVANGIFNRNKPAPAATPTCDVIGVHGCETKGANGGGPAIVPTIAAVKTPPDPKGFTIGITILRKACFGSAGCNVTFRIDPSYNGADYTHTMTWRVVYQVSGTKDAYTNSFTLTGSEASFQSAEMVETASSSANLTATAVSVVEA